MIGEAVARRFADLPGARRDFWYVRGHAVFACLAALDAAGILGELRAGQPIGLDAEARRRGLDPGLLEAICRYLFGLGILDRDETRRYRLGVALEEADVAHLEVFRAYDRLFHDLPRLLAGARESGGGLAGRHDGLDVRASARVGRTAWYPAVVEQIAAAGARRVLDLGCGSGELLVQACTALPGLTGVGLDLSAEAVDYARHRVREAGLVGRVAVVRGDVLSLADACRRSPLASLTVSVDLVVSTMVFHEFAYRDLRGLVRALGEVRRAFPNLELVLFEAEEQPDEALREDPSFALEHHLFHRLSRQGIAVPDAWHRGFAEAGYRLRREARTPGGGVLFVLG